MEISANYINENPCTHGWPRMFVDKINVNPKNDPLNLDKINFGININLLNISLQFTLPYTFLT